MSQSWARAAILTISRLQHTNVQLAEHFASTLNPVRAWRTVLQSGSQLVKAMVRLAQSVCKRGSAMQRREEGFYLVYR